MITPKDFELTAKMIDLLREYPQDVSIRVLRVALAAFETMPPTESDMPEAS